MPKFLLPRSEIGNAGQIPVNGQPVRVGEILIVFAVGVVVLLGGLRLFGNGPLASVLGIWMANLAMLSAIYWGLRSRGQQWDHLGLGLGLGLGFRADGFDFGLILSVFLRSLPVFVFAIMAFVAGAVLMANIFGVPEPADMSKCCHRRHLRRRRRRCDAHRARSAENQSARNTCDSVSLSRQYFGVDETWRRPRRQRRGAGKQSVVGIARRRLSRSLVNERVEQRSDAERLNAGSRRRSGVDARCECS